MGSLIYGADAIEVQFDDRVLAHVQVVIGSKLRRRESFFFSWSDTEAGEGRSAVWIDSSIPLHFRYTSNAQPPLNKAWLEEMSIAAGSNFGLVLSEEPAPRAEPAAAATAKAKPVPSK